MDVGSLHPKYVSNTHKLYKKGWRGINIDPNPTTQKLFEFYRPRDINICAGVAQTQQKLTYYEFEYAGLNSFDSKYVDFRVKERGNTVQRQTQIDCYPLVTIFEENLPEGTPIDLLDVDVEGFDIEVLKSNNWSKYRPQVILVEDRNFRNELTGSKIFSYLANNNYTFFCYNNITLIMTDKNNPL